MANRSYTELAATAEFEHRFYLGSLRDFTGNGHDGGLISCELSRGPRGLVGVHCDGYASGEKLNVTLIPIGVNQAYSYEIVFFATIATGAAVWVRLAQGLGNLDIIWDTANLRFRLEGSANLTSANGSVVDGVVHHAVFTRATDGTGTIYLNGVSIASGAIGTDAEDFNRFFNSGGGSNALHGWAYYQRGWIGDDLSEDEAALLYTNSQHLFEPGSHKVSGIFSPVR